MEDIKIEVYDKEEYKSINAMLGTKNIGVAEISLYSEMWYFNRLNTIIEKIKELKEMIYSDIILKKRM